MPSDLNKDDDTDETTESLCFPDNIPSSTTQNIASEEFLTSQSNLVINESDDTENQELSTRNFTVYDFYVNKVFSSIFVVGGRFNLLSKYNQFCNECVRDPLIIINSI